MHGSDDVAVCEGADVIAITAGAKQRPGQTRLELAGTNVEICRAMMPKLLDVAPNAVIVMVTNPVDVLTLAALKFSGLPAAAGAGQRHGAGLLAAPRSDRPASRGRVTERPRVDCRRARRLGVPAVEHGHRRGPFRCRASRCLAAIGWTPGPRSRSRREVVTAAERIIRGKGATNYAVGLAATRVIEAILRDENAVLAVSSLLDGRYGLNDVCLSLPSVVNRTGVATMLDAPMSQRELELLKASAAAVRAVADSLGI